MRFLLPLLTVAALWAQDPAASQDSLNQGVQAFRSARYPDAVLAFQRAVDLDPSNLNARLYLATAYMQQYIPGAGTPENDQLAARAQGAFLQVLALDPNNGVAMTSLASLSLNQKRWEEARSWFERIIAVDPRNAGAYYSLGFIAWSQWYPVYGQARTNLGIKQADPGPLPNGNVKRDLKARFAEVLDAGIVNLQRALEVNPQYEDAMAYMNLLIRERADLRDTPEEWRQDTALADQWVQKALDTKRLKGQFATQNGTAQTAAAGVRIRVSSPVQEQKLIHRVDPIYPALALQARIQGIVRFNLTVSKEGAVQDVMVISGHPLLVPAAIDAVKQWVYQPTLLNGVPTEVNTQADVNFSLDGPLPR
jgi:TonB family protein